MAPSACNAQEWRFILITDPELRANIAEAGGQPFLRQCPVIVAACAITNRRVMRCGEVAYLVGRRHPPWTTLCSPRKRWAWEPATLDLSTRIRSGKSWAFRMTCPSPRSSLSAIRRKKRSRVHAKHRLSIDEILMENRWGEPLS